MSALDKACVEYVEVLWLKDVPWFPVIDQPQDPMHFTPSQPQSEHAAPHAALLRAMGVPKPTPEEIEQKRLAVIAAVREECER